MKFKGIVVLFMMLWLAVPAAAHRLNEYLQATTIFLFKDHITLQLRLTPGTDVAGKIMLIIDRNHDGAITEEEQRTYASNVTHELLLWVNGRPKQLQLDSLSFPKLEEVYKGLGDIIISLSASLPPGTSQHTLKLKNHHQRSISVYLVNCLLPNNPDIQVMGQSRTYDQSVYQLSFTTDKALLARASSVSGELEAKQRLIQADNRAVLKTFIFQGIRHILTGYDHLLFIAALVLGANTLWDLVKVVTAFTLAHSITLTLAALRLVQLPEQIVEAGIAASIIFVALQNVFHPAAAQGNSRLAIAFLFGLLHGLGFAGGLLEVMHQMPGVTITLAIIGFTIGVEIGNQVTLLLLFGLLQTLRTSRPNLLLNDRLRRSIQCTLSLSIAMAGIYYFYLAI
ncbi:HupE/UreJ family protein [Mucilaginibacter robiniae]|uniref:HupE/UreJ family protein n=1 Tax=Mucilaginibacter robiniae TaxID=2728022 RepID=A0A7L5E3V4_9SPHI|nr:HupE/UreJ family protein [Mucilaginibacter robiniae]QJD95493.1 HupE/UreJ family protein [Mucilaginibacter robiniae]